MSTQANFVFTINITMSIADTATIDDAVSVIEDAVWSDLPGADFDVESLYVSGTLA